MDLVRFLSMRTSLCATTVLGFVSLFCSVSFGQSPSASMSASQIGLTGEILISPIHGGPTRQGVPDSAPLAHKQFVVATTGNSRVTSFQTDDKGQFRISLPPGHYTITATEKSGLGKYGPFEVD